MEKVTSIRTLVAAALTAALLAGANALARDNDDNSAPSAGAHGTRGDRASDSATRVYGPGASPDASAGRSPRASDNGAATIAPARRTWAAPSTDDASKAPKTIDWTPQRPDVSLGGPSPRTVKNRTSSDWRGLGTSDKSPVVESSGKTSTAWRTLGTDRSAGQATDIRRGTGERTSTRTTDGFLRGRAPVQRLPEGAKAYDWGGHRYHHHGHHWWRPWWYGGNVYYYWVYPPIGYYYPTLPGGYVTILIGGSTYYVGDGVYYGTSPDGVGYVVAEPPADVAPAEVPPPAQPSPLPQPDNANPPVPLGQPGPPKAPDPYDVLKQMADALGALPRLTLNVGDSFEDVVGNERKELQGQFSLFLRRPDKFALQYRGDMYDRNVIYDGTGVTLLNLRKNVYWRAAAPGTIPEALAALARDYRVSMPLAELIVADYNGLASAIQSGRHLGFDTVGERTYHHLGFSEASVDWEVWIETDGPAIPRRYAVTYKQLPGQPRYVATVLSWDTGPVADSNFQLPAPPPP